MRPRLLAALVVCVLLAATGCQPARAGRRCHTSDWGDDGAYVLRCERGRWRRVMTRGQAARFLQAIAAARTTTTTTTTPPQLPAPLNSTQLFRGLGGVAANAEVRVTSVSRNGRFVGAESAASNLVAGDTNATTDAFVLDTVTGVVTLVSENSDASGPGDDISGGPLVTDDGTAAYFISYSSNLVDPPTDQGDLHTYRRDLLTGTTEMIGLMPGDIEPDAPIVPLSISADGGRIAVASGATNLVVGDTNGGSDYFVYDVGARTYTRASLSSAGVQADHLVDASAPVFEAQLSADGTVLVFDSIASTLVAGDTNGVADVFARDLTAETTERVSVADAGSQLNGASFALSASDGAGRVAFRTLGTSPAAAGPLVGTYVRDRSVGRTFAGATALVAPDGRHTLVRIVGAHLSGDGLALVGVGEWTDDPDGTVGDVRHLVGTAATTYGNRIEPQCRGQRFLTASNVVTCVDGRRWTMP